MRVGKIKADDKDANIVVTPSDALVIDTEEFRRTIKVALDFTANSNAIVTLGMKPTRPETGYGYIEASKDFGTDEIGRGAKAFKEKPNFELAEKYLADGNFFWNAGIFVWNVSSIVSELRTYAPQITGIMDELSPLFGTQIRKKRNRSCFSLNVKRFPLTMRLWKSLRTYLSFLQNLDGVI